MDGYVPSVYYLYIVHSRTGTVGIINHLTISCVCLIDQLLSALVNTMFGPVVTQTQHIESDADTSTDKQHLHLEASSTPSS